MRNNEQTNGRTTEPVEVLDFSHFALYSTERKKEKNNCQPHCMVSAAPSLSSLFAFPSLCSVSFTPLPPDKSTAIWRNVFKFNFKNGFWIAIVFCVYCVCCCVSSGSAQRFPVLVKWTCRSIRTSFYARVRAQRIARQPPHTMWILSHLTETGSQSNPVSFFCFVLRQGEKKNGGDVHIHSSETFVGCRGARLFAHSNQ